MPDKVLRHVGQFSLRQHRTAGRKLGQIGAHGGKVQLGPVNRIGGDTAVGDDQRVLNQLATMRPDATRNPFPDPGKAGNIPQANPAL